MLIQLLAILGFAALFIGFVLLRPADGRSGCHGCRDPEGAGGCGRKCALPEPARKPAARRPS
jgi:hypothetical protein